MTKKLNYNICMLRVISALLVVMLHISQPLVSNYYLYGKEVWWGANLLNVLSRFAVPIFFMVSGALLLTKIEDPIKFYKNRFLNILIPFIIWSFVLIVYKNAGDLTQISLKNSLIEIIQNQVYFHLWFYYDLISIYILVPIMRKIIVALNEKELLFILVLWGVFNNIIPTMQFSFDFNIAIKNMFFVGNIGYFLLGYYLKTYVVERINLIKSGIIFVIGYVGSVILVYKSIYLDSGGVDQFFYSGNSAFILIMSIGIFIFINKIRFADNSILKKLIIFLNGYTVGIYFLHPIIIDILIKFNISIDRIPKFYGLIIIYLVVLSICLIIISIMKKIPFVKKVV